MIRQKCKWIVDTEILESRSLVDNIPQAIRNVGREVYETKYRPLDDNQDYDVTNGKAWTSPSVIDGQWMEDGMFGPLYEWERPKMLYGTIGFVQKCHYAFIPGNYGINDNTNCNFYYPQIPKQWMLNGDFVMAPYKVIRNQSERFFDLFDTDDLFIRPNSGRKSFTGFTFTRENAKSELHSYKSLEKVPDEEICLISPAINLKAEFRFVVGNREVIDGSEYRWDNILDVRHDWLEDCHKLAVKMAQHAWQPDTCYTVDVADTADGPKIVELNGFSCAGLYACDKELVFGRVSEIAEADFYGDI